MTYANLNRQRQDVALTERVTGCALTEAWNNPELSATAYAVALKRADANAVQLMWPVSIATAEQYQYAVDNGNPDPGGDESVVTDDAILAAVQASWPDDAAVAAARDE
jgi:hypothetical protein